MNADAIVTLPGGPGTLDELFEVLTWRQLGLHAQPVLLLNVGGYWTPLLALLETTSSLTTLPRARGVRGSSRPARGYASKRPTSRPVAPDVRSR